MADHLLTTFSPQRSPPMTMSADNGGNALEGRAEDVAMLCQGSDGYGIGTIIKLYAIAFPRMSFVAMSEGEIVDWMRERGNRVDVVHGLGEFREGGSSLWTLARLPGAVARAHGDAMRIDKLLRARGIRIVHAHWRPQQFMAGFLRRRGYKSVWQLNANTTASRLWGAGPWLNNRYAKWGADLLLPASDFIGRNWQMSRVPMRTIRNAAVPIFERPNELPKWPLRCIVAGRMVHLKGHHLAVEAVIHARQAGYDVRLDIYGGPLERNEYADGLRQRIEAAGCAETIEFKGFREEMRSLHQQYHVGMQCRIDPEPCSLWVCEAMVDGLPLLASATGGTPELVADGESGLLYPTDDVDALTKKLIELAADPARLHAMRAKAFERGRQLFTLERFAKETLAAYDSLAS